MRIFSAANFYQEVNLFLRDWIKLLSENKFTDACSLLDVPSDTSKNIVWNGDNLKEVFLDYCWHERMHEINNPYLMNLEEEKIDFYKYNDDNDYAIDYDIPINNEWGDLTAQFSLVNCTEDLYYLYLKDIHVL